MSSVSVTVVIPNYNGLHFLEDCLASLEKQSCRNFDVVLVDNGSKDGSIEFVKTQYPTVKVMELSRNYGFCRAVNLGIKASTAEYIILLNNDTKSEENFIEELVKDISKRPACFSCQAKMVQMHHPQKIDDAGNYYCALGWAFAFGKGKDSVNYQEERSIFASCGGAAIYRKKIFEEIGYFDELHFAYLEDIDIGYRAKIAGYENRYTPKAVVHHAGSGTTGSTYNDFKIRYSARNSIYLIYKNMPILQILINSPFLLAGFCIKAVFFWKKGYTKEYLAGLKSGLALAKSENKVKFKIKNIGNYMKIQTELWYNMKKRLENPR